MAKIEQKTLTSGLEDYIEEIYLSQQDSTPLKAVQLARKLNVSRASVSEALTRLVALGLIIYNRYEAITLTQKGIEEAKKVYLKHSIIKQFFENVLEIEPEEASENACKIEHIISQNVLDKMAEFTKNYKN